jgi:prophage regulatory protein
MSQFLQRPSPARPKILNVNELRAEIGLSQRTVWEMVSAGHFPRPIRIGPRRVGWLAAEVDAWLAERIRERDEELAHPKPEKPRRPVGRPRKNPIPEEQQATQ